MALANSGTTMFVIDRVALNSGTIVGFGMNCLAFNCETNED